VAASARATGIPAGTVLDVGDQQQFLETLFKTSGALNGAPYKVRFDQFGSGPLVDAGFAAGRIDLGFMGDLPASFAVKSGLPVRAVAALLPIGASEYLLAKPGITAIAQLRGRAVAYTTGTAEQAFALRALASVGLTQRDVRQVNVSLLQLGTVLESGAADASVLSVEQKVDYQQNHPGSAVLATIDTVKPASYLYFLATTAALADTAKQAAISDFTKRLIAASNWEKANKAQYIQAYYVGVEHQTKTNAKLILAAGGSYNFVPLDSSEQSALQNVVDLLTHAGALAAGYSVAPLFDSGAAAKYNAILREVPQDD
jgi:sulfonate transport system substrate-binding protein